MVSFKSLFITVATAAIVLAVPFPSASRSVGDFFTLIDGNGLDFNDLDGGEFTLSWSSPKGPVFGGKGWIPGSPQSTIHYSGNYKPVTASSFLGVFGRTSNPAVDYYIVESWASTFPLSTSGSATSKGSVICDGSATYSIYEVTGEDGKKQIWSIRAHRKDPGSEISGVVTVACHGKAWKRAGLTLGSKHDFQILAIQGDSGSGSADITVS